MSEQGPSASVLSNRENTILAIAIGLLDAAYADYYERSDGYGKSQEGAVSVTFGNYFDRQKADRTLEIEVYSYVFATGRRETFSSVEEFRDWAHVTLVDQIATVYDEYGDVIHPTDRAR